MKNLFNSTLVCSRYHIMVTFKRSLLLLMLLFSVPSFAQDCVTKFMGIPVDGTKEEIFSALEKKGFKNYGEYLVGEFNGKESEISISANKGKVYGVYVHYNSNNGPMDEQLVASIFNSLFMAFSNNPKYVYSAGEMIPEGEDVEHEMWVNKKSYIALFNQIGECPEYIDNRTVAFNICRAGYLKFYICIGYFNENNKPNGEDL